MKGNFKRELIGTEGMVILDTARRLIRRNAVDNLMKLVGKTHPADIAWVFRHFVPNERKFVFNIIAQTDYLGEFLSELDQSIMLELVEDLTPRFMANIVKNLLACTRDQSLAVARANFEEAFNATKLMLSQSGLPIDKYKIVNGKTVPVQTTTSPTNIGMGLTSYVAARDLKIVTENALPVVADGVLFSNIADASFVPVIVDYVLSTDTTAGKLVAVY